MLTGCRRFLVLLSCIPTVAHAHGINGHVWVSEQGLAGLRECNTELRELLDEADARNAYRFGAAFPDSGYATSRGREYGEAAHWERFLQFMIDDWRARFSRRLDDPEARRRAAFILGMAQHGLQDELFDSLFMRRAAESGDNEDLIDTGTDFVLVEEGVANVRPTPWYPADITTVYAAAGITVDSEVIDNGIFAVDKVVLGLQDSHPAGLADEYRPELTWSTAHMLDARIPGAHAWEQQFVAPYVEQLWMRLTWPVDRLAQRDPWIGLVPVTDGVVATTDAVTIRSWVTLVFGVGLRVGDLASAVTVRDEDGDIVPVKVRGSRWAGQHDDYSRLIQIAPVPAWAAGQRYTIAVSDSVKTVDGVPLKVPVYTSFVVCADEACAVDAGLSRADSAWCEARLAGGCTASPGNGADAGLGWLLPPLLWFWRRR